MGLMDARATVSRVLGPATLPLTLLFTARPPDVARPCTSFRCARHLQTSAQNRLRSLTVHRLLALAASAAAGRGERQGTDDLSCLRTSPPKAIHVRGAGLLRPRSARSPRRCRSGLLELSCTGVPSSSVTAFAFTRAECSYGTVAARIGPLRTITIAHARMGRPSACPRSLRSEVPHITTTSPQPQPLPTRTPPTIPPYPSHTHSPTSTQKLGV